MDENIAAVENQVSNDAPAQRSELPSGAGKSRDIIGRVALSLLGAGLIGVILLVLLFAGVFGGSQALFFVAVILIVVTAPAAVPVSIAGLVRAHRLHVKAPLSLIALLVSVLGTIAILLPFVLIATGVVRF